MKQVPSPDGEKSWVAGSCAGVLGGALPKCICGQRKSSFPAKVVPGRKTSTRLSSEPRRKEKRYLKKCFFTSQNRRSCFSNVHRSSRAHTAAKAGNWRFTCPQVHAGSMKRKVHRTCIGCIVMQKLGRPARRPMR